MSSRSTLSTKEPSRLLVLPTTLASYALLAVLALATLLRLLGITYDSPFMLEGDETRVLYVTLHLFSAHSLDPQFYAYGPFLMYLGALWLLPYFAVSALTGHASVPTILSYGSSMATITDPALHVYARLLFVAMGVITVYLAFLCARRLAGYWAGVLAALLVALSPLQVYQAHFELPNTPTGFFALLTVWFTLRYLQNAGQEQAHVGQRRRFWQRWHDRLFLAGSYDLTLATIAAAWGSAIKYNAVVLLGLPLLALLLQRGRANSPRQLLVSMVRLLLLSVIAFLLVTPVALSNTLAFVHGAGYELKHYSQLGGGATGGGPSIIWYGRYLIENEGGLLFPITVVGLSILVWRKRAPTDLMILLCIVVYYLLIGVQEAHYDRNLLVILPLIEVAFAYIMVLLARQIRSYGWVAALLLTVSALGLLGSGTSAQTQTFLSTPAQLAAQRWLEQHLPRYCTLVANGYTVPTLNRPDVRVMYFDDLSLSPSQIWHTGARYVVLSKSLWYYLIPGHLASKGVVMHLIYTTGNVNVYSLSNAAST